MLLSIPARCQPLDNFCWWSRQVFPWSRWVTHKITGFWHSSTCMYVCVGLGNCPVTALLIHGVAIVSAHPWCGNCLCSSMGKLVTLNVCQSLPLDWFNHLFRMVSIVLSQVAQNLKLSYHMQREHLGSFSYLSPPTWMSFSIPERTNQTVL